MKIYFGLLIASAIVFGVAHADTLADLRSSQTLACGLVTDEDDFSKDDTHGNMTAFGADICRAVASAAAGSGAKVLVHGFGDEPAALRALAARNVAMIGSATPTLENEAVYHAGFASALVYDGQGFLVAKDAAIGTIDGLAGKQICFIAGTQAGDNLPEVMRERGLRYLSFPFEERGEMEAALVTGHCAAVTADVSQLANMRAAFLSRTKDFVILPEMVSRDPAAPAYRDDDRVWARIVDWTVNVLIQAEEDGVTKANIDTVKSGENAAMRQLLDDAGSARELGLDKGWVYRAIKAAGNLDEIYDRDVGAGSPLKLERGAGNPWRSGGVLYAEPVR